MKRRKFLGLFGAAVTAPLAPLPALGGAATMGAVYSKSALHAAIFHAQSRVSFSVWGLAQTLGVPTAQAEALMHDMAQRGILGPLQGTTFGGRWANSNILMNKTAAAAQAARKTHTLKTETKTNARKTEADLGLLLSHLRDICRKQGMTLSPRCAV